MFPAHWATTKPDAIAVAVANGRSITYAELDDRSRRLVTILRQRGIGVGDHIAVQLPNVPEFFEIVWAALLSGAHISPISTHATAEDLAYILTDSTSRLFITSEEQAGRLAMISNDVPTCPNRLCLGEATGDFDSYDRALASATPAPADPDAPMGDYMLYSSGTTGKPKGVRRAPSNRPVSKGSIANRFLSKVFSVGDDSVFLSPAPLYHGAPLGFSIGVTSLGGTVVVMEKFDAAEALRVIERYRVTHSQWVPTMFVRMLALPEEIREAGDITSQRVAIHSAAPCPRHVKEAMMQWWGPILHEYYSGTEDVGVTYASPQQWLAHPGTVGRPLGFRIHICDEVGDDVPTGTAGLIYFETHGGAFEYHGDSTKTGKSRHSRHPNWVTLDDIGYLDDDGFLYLTDRASFMIISGGVNIYPREVEDVLLRHPAVADVGVIGLPDDEFGEQVKAVVEVAEGYTRGGELESELLQFARDNLAGPKRPRSYTFVDTLPRMDTGKLAKKELRRMFTT